MKVTFLGLAIVILLTIVALVPTQAQSKKGPIVSHEGSWVIETSAKGRQSIVRFYTNESRLIYEETVDRRLDISRPKIKRQLNAALEQALYVWNATHKIPADRQWVAIQFDKW